MDPTEAVRRLLDALEIPAERIPADPDAQSATYRTAVAVTIYRCMISHVTYVMTRRNAQDLSNME